VERSAPQFFIFYAQCKNEKLQRNRKFERNTNGRKRRNYAIILLSGISLKFGKNGGDDMPKTKPTYAESLARISSADDAIKQALAKKRQLIEQSKVIAYDEIAQLYDAEGQELIDAVTQEHTLIGKLTASGMTYEQIAELADGSPNNGVGEQLTFESEKRNPYED
jgi:hypothetical protein